MTLHDVFFLNFEERNGNSYLMFTLLDVETSVKA